MATDKIRVLIVMLIAVMSVSVGEMLLAKGMKQTNLLTGSFWEQARGTMGNGYVLLGTALMATFFILYSAALKQADFSYVLPLTALSYLVGAALAKTYLHETVTGWRWVGTLIITIGVAVVVWGESGASRTP